MIECARTRSLLGRYLDGELAVEEIPPVEGHLRVCQLCAQELGAMRGVSAALRMVAVPPVPEQLAGRVVGRALEQAAAPSSFRESLRFWAGWSLSMRFAATATAAAACFLGFLIGGSPLPASRPAADEVQWAGFTARGPIATAYLGSSR